MSAEMRQELAPFPEAGLFEFDLLPQAAKNVIANGNDNSPKPLNRFIVNLRICLIVQKIGPLANFFHTSSQIHLCPIAFGVSAGKEHN